VTSVLEDGSGRPSDVDKAQRMALEASAPRRPFAWLPRARVAAVPLLVLAVANAAMVTAFLVGWSAAALAVLIVVPLVFALRSRPQLGVLALAALAPFDGLLIITPHPQIARSWKEALVLATLAATFVAPAEARSRRGRPVPRWLPAVVLLVVLGVVSGAVVGGQQALTGLRIDFFYLLVPVILWRCRLSGVERDRLVTILMATGVITAVIGLGQQAIGAAGLHDLGYAWNTNIRLAGGFVRSFSTFEQPFPFGFFLMVVILVGVAVALADRSRLRNRLFLLTLPVMVLALAATLVRGAWLGLGVGLVYLGIRRYRVLFLIAPMALIVLLYLPGSLTAPALSGSSLSARGSGWDANIHQVVSHPLGAGIGSTGAAGEKVASLTGVGTAYQPDNYYFKTVYELGVFGLWLFVIAIVSIFMSMDKAAPRLSGRDSSLALGVSATVLAAIAASLVATYFEIFQMALLFWLLVGVVATCDRD
jgi:hypothetical protein